VVRGKSAIRSVSAVVALVAVCSLGADHAGAANTSSQRACTAKATIALVETFAADFRNGKISPIEGLWAPAPRFQWYSTRAPGARIGASAYERSTLMHYFRARARLHERLRIVQLRARLDPERGIVNFSGKLVRSADDLRPALLDFKGAAECLSSRPMLIVWSM
jgi:hypothetical protein